MQIRSKKDLSHVTLSLWRDETLQQITEKSGPLTAENEYQFHYWSLVLRKIAADGSILDISIPTVIFNYPQKVADLSIKFDLKHVEEYSDQLLPIHNIEVNELAEVLDFSQFTEIISTPLNSVHRHPNGRNQAFSPTDLDTNPKDPGIVFPLAESPTLRSNVASIIVHSAGKTYLAHTESRIVKGDIASKEGISYYRTRSASYIKGTPTHPSTVEMMFGYTPTEDTYTVSNDLLSEAVHSFISFWDTLDYSPNTEYIESKHLSEKTPVNHKSCYGQSTLGLYDDDEEWAAGYLYKPSEEPIISSQDRQTATKALSDIGIDILPYTSLYALSPLESARHYAKLEAVYYNDPEFLLTPYEDASITLEDIIELQDNLVEEYASFPPTTPVESVTDYMKTSLADYGISKTTLDTMSPNEVEATFTKLQSQ